MDGNRNYNEHIDMCSRETCSVLPSGWIAGLLILLTAFLIGVLAVESVRWLDHYPFTKPSTSKPCINEDGISVRRVYPRLEGNRTSIPVLLLSNYGIKPAYYFVDNLGNLIDFDNSDILGREPKALMPGGNSDVFSAAKYDQDSLILTFSYFHGDSQKIRSVTMYFDSGSSMPDRCSYR